MRTDNVGQFYLAAARARSARSHDRLSRLGWGRLEQLQRRGRSCQVLARKMEVAQRRADVAVAKQPLDGVDVHPGLEKMRGKGVAQRMNAACLDDAGTRLGSVVDPVHRFLADRPRRIL